MDEILDVARPVVEHAACEGGAGVEVMLADELEQFLARNAVLDERELDHVHVAEVVERMLGVIDVGHASRHTCGKVAARLAEHHDASTGHVFAAMVACTLDDGDGSGVAYAETFAHTTVDVQFAAGGTIEAGIACDDILFGVEGVARTGRW